MTAPTAPRPAAGLSERVAVIDIGSNSIRLVVYDGLKRAPLPIFNEKVLCGLGRGVEKTGRLNPDGVAQALVNLQRFRHLAEGMRVGRLDVLATAAVRDAADGAAFVAAVKEQAGLTISVVSGEGEARLSAQGVLSGTPGADGLVGDLGGGSLELVTLDRGVMGPQVTLPLGPLRLMEAGEGRNAIVRTIDQHLESLPWLGAAKGRPFHPVGGSWRALAKLHMEQTGHPLHIIHHYTVPGDAAREFAASIVRRDRAALEKIMAGSKRRLDTLPYAALVFERLLKLVQPSQVVFSAFGLREGHLYGLLPQEEQRHDPLLAAGEDWSNRFGRFGDAALLVNWTGGLFAGEDEQALRLRHAACLLSDLGWAEHPDYRAEHAFLRVLRFPFPGIDHAGRVFLALSGYARYAGSLDGAGSEPLRRLLTEGQTLRALVLGLALRLAHTLSGGATAQLQRTSLRLTEEALELTLPGDAAELNGDVVSRRLDALARALNRKARITVLPDAAGG